MTQQEIEELAGHRKVSAWVIKLVCDAVAKEREACAQLCQDLWEDDATAWDCAVAIEERGNK